MLAGLFVGMIVGICTDPIWRRWYDKLVQSNTPEGEEPVSEPEFRLPSTIFGAILVPVALFGEHSLALESQPVF